MKISIVIVACTFSAFFCVAQSTYSDPRNRLNFGVKAGVNRSNVYDAKGQDFKADAKMGFAGGAFLGIPIGTYLGVQPEVLISQKGSQTSGMLFGDAYSDKRTTTYLDVPIQLQLKPIEFVTFLVGIQYSYLLHQKDVYAFGANSVAQNQEFKNDNARKNIVGAVLGIDIHVSHFVFSTKACWDLQNNVGDGSSYTPRYKNVWLQATVGFRLY